MLDAEAVVGVALLVQPTDHFGPEMAAQAFRSAAGEFHELGMPAERGNRCPLNSSVGEPAQASVAGSIGRT